jgi:hypothetical protein
LREAEGVFCRFSKPNGFVSPRSAFVELSEIGKAPD